MKVVYEITILGIAFTQSRSATGISRVIENLAFALNDVPQCELILASIEHEIKSRAYLKSTPQLSRLPQVKGKFDAFLYDNLDYLSRAIFRPSVVKNIPLRLYRRALLQLSSITKSSHYPLGRGVLEKSDIFHSTFLPPPQQVREMKGIQRFQTVYDIIPLIHPEWFSDNEADVLRKVVTSLQPDDYVLAISQATKDDLCNHINFDPDRVIVTPLAANREVFYPSRDEKKLRYVREKYGLPDAPYVLSLATLEPRKNTEHLIRCFANMVRQQNIEDLYLVLTGSKGWQYDTIFQQIDGLEELQGRVIVTGRVEDEDLATLYSYAMMFAYPSLYEGFGLPPLEAMQCGVPVVTSNVSSLPEVVADAGILIAPKDADALSHSLYNLYRDAPLREKLSAQGLQRAQQFSWEKCAQETVRAYNKALAN